MSHRCFTVCLTGFSCLYRSSNQMINCLSNLISYRVELQIGYSEDEII